MARKKHAGGRPTLMTETVVGKLEVAFSVGANISQACLVAGISRDTYYDYIKKNVRYADRFEQLRQKPVLAAKKRVVDAIVEENDTSTAKWFLERKCKEEFGQHHKLDVHIEKTPLSEKEIAQQLAALIQKSRDRRNAEVEEVGYVRGELVAR